MKRRQLLIKKDFQLRQMVMAAATVIILVNAAVLGSLLWFGLPESGEVPWLEIWLLALLEIAMLVVVIRGALRQSHAAAGPVLVLEKELERLGSGDLTGSIQFRKSDYFQEAAETFNATTVALAAKMKGVQSAADDLAAAIPDDDKPMRERVDRLRKALAEFKLETPQGGGGESPGVR